MPDDVNTRVPHGGLYDIAVHPQYAENGFIYFTYAKSRIGNAFDDFRWDGANRVEGSKREAAAVALVRARYDGGSSLTDVKEIFLADAWAQGSSAGRLVFGLDGKIILSVGLPTRHQVGTAEMAQDPANHAGKILRLNDDGNCPSGQSVRRSGGLPSRDLRVRYPERSWAFRASGDTVSFGN